MTAADCSLDDPCVEVASMRPVLNPELRTLVFAPLGRDGPLTSEVLSRGGVTAENCPTAADLCEKADEGCAMLVLAEEGLDATSTAGLKEILTHQPTWSDVPVIVVTSDGRIGGERLQRLQLFGPTANVTLLERPFRPATLVSAVEAGLRARRRQYQVRDLLMELQEARDASDRANQAKDDFLAALSHELRTPLNPVLLLASEAAVDPTVPATIRRDFDMIARSVELEAHLIDDLLDLTRITRGKVVLDLHPLDIHAVLRDALKAIQTELKGRILDVRLDLRANRTDVQADPVRLLQVLWNVLKNAVKFTADRGAIVLATHNPPGADLVTITISDTGIGLTPGEITAVFDAFAQGEHAGRESAQRFGGLGLGLAISRMLLELHGGTIRATSPGRGHGSSFLIELPLAAAAPPPVNSPTVRTEQTSSPRRNGSSGHQPRTVLLVEDHEPTRASLARLLERRGYVVTAAGSLAEARDAAALEKFDLLISDLGLPDGNGWDLMVTLRPHVKHSIALSGYGMESDKERTRLAGFDTHLVKPLTIQSLDGALESLFRSGAITR